MLGMFRENCCVCAWGESRTALGSGRSDKGCSLILLPCFISDRIQDAKVKIDQTLKYLYAK